MSNKKYPRTFMYIATLSSGGIVHGKRCLLVHVPQELVLYACINPI